MIFVSYSHFIRYSSTYIPNMKTFPFFIPEKKRQIGFQTKISVTHRFRCFTSCQPRPFYLGIIGRVKRAPHWGVQSRFRMIYMFRTDAQLCPVTQPVIPLHSRPSRYPTCSDKQELGGDTQPAGILFTGEWCYPYLLGCAEDLGVWV